MKIIYTLLLTILSTSLLFAQVSEEWVSRFNGAANLNDGGTSIAVSNDGFIYVCGITEVSFTRRDYILIKYDQQGNEIWTRTFNGPGNGYDQAVSVTVDQNGNPIITGSSMQTQSFGSEEIATIKYDAQGNLLWVARYNGPADESDYPVRVMTDAAGNVYVAGVSRGVGTGNDVVALKYNSQGNLLWVTRYNNPENTDDNAFYMTLDNAGNIYITGWAIINFTLDFLTIKIDTDGNINWVKIYNGPTYYDDKSYSVGVDSKGNVFVTGCSQGIGTGEYDYATIKYSSSGELQWVKRYNGIDEGLDIANTLTIDENDFIYIAGISDGEGTGKDIAVVKYDQSGNEVWTRRYNSPFNFDEEAYVITNDGLGGIYVIGYSFSSGVNADYITLKYTTAGDFVWAKRYDGPASSFDNALAVAIYNSDVYVTGVSAGVGTGFDIATIKYSQLTSITQITQETPENFKIYQNFPNPFNPQTTIRFDIHEASDVTLKVYDISGKLISDLIQQRLSAGSYDVNFVSESLPSGVYIYTLSIGNQSATRRMTLLK